MKRRTVLKVAGAAGLSTALPLTAGQVSAITGDTPLDFTDHRWVDELPRPGVLTPESRKKGVERYELKLTEFSQTVLPSSMNMETTLWGYGGSYPASTIEATPGKPVKVDYNLDQLPTDHLLSVDPNVHGAESTNPAVRIATHLHGGVVKPEDDGYPEAWASPDGTTNDDSPVPYKGVKEYPNDQQPGTLWYHDHAIGITRLNVYAGLAGFYLLRDPMEKKLPCGDYEIPIVIQDRTFNDDGSLFYPPGDDNNYEAEFAGDVPVVNGKAYPTLTVEPRPYRLRLLNGSNGRTFNLQLFNEDAASGEEFIDVPLMEQIGVDLGFLDAPVPLGPGQSIESLLLSGAERADIIVDFSDYDGQGFLVKNNAEFPYAGENNGPDIPSMSDILRIEVKETTCGRHNHEYGHGQGHGHHNHGLKLQKFLDRINCKYPDPDVKESGITRTHTLDTGSLEVADGVKYDTHFLNLSLWDDEDAIVRPKLGTSEIWELYNTTADSHPIHLHLVDFEVKNRESFTWDDGTETGEAYQEDSQTFLDSGADTDLERPEIGEYVTLSGNPIPPDPNIAENKDTVLVNPREVIRINPAFTGFSGLYPWHCHILEHEDQEMMLPYEVVDEKSC